MTKQEMLPKGVGVAKFDFSKTFRNQLFSGVRELYHQYSITNHSESIGMYSHRVGGNGKCQYYRGT